MAAGLHSIGVMMKVYIYKVQVKTSKPVMIIIDQPVHVRNGDLLAVDAKHEAAMKMYAGFIDKIDEVVASRLRYGAFDFVRQVDYKAGETQANVAEAEPHNDAASPAKQDKSMRSKRKRRKVVKDGSDDS